MGPKQSSPAASARLRAYSGSDVPTSTSTAAGSGSTSAAAIRYYTGNQQQVGARGRYGADGARPNSLFQPTIIAQGGVDQSDEDADGERSQSGPRLLIGSLPAHLSPHLLGGFNCPVCSKFVASDEIDLHLVMCLTKPRLTYNGSFKARFPACPSLPDLITDLLYKEEAEVGRGPTVAAWWTLDRTHNLLIGHPTS
ncbi:E3 ubiquitin-protein ligase znrf2-like isoform X4 [Tachysurus fulvidraco]|uniref:E3 ubiquitin-protein ligase znrf2-like isoform X4 n=1 Tax=Tachysurus fulvidraco TaxID=1234273 RepID=UPI001FF06E28|nr:E3 ubiquitin-protein ligase znrf2-like isoform X4 [Tachysurus fulvidraco]